MSKLLEIEHHPSGVRIFVQGQRVHHGALSIVLGSVAAMLAYHDRRDWRTWFRRGDQREPA